MEESDFTIDDEEYEVVDHKDRWWEDEAHVWSQKAKEDFISIYDPDNQLGLLRTAPGATYMVEDPGTISMTSVVPVRHPNSARFHEILGELGALHDRKQADYGKGDDPFANVRSSEEWGVDGWKGAMIRLNDKVKRLQNYSRNGTLKNEGVEDSFMDIAVYAVIAYVLWEQEQS